MTAANSTAIPDPGLRLVTPEDHPDGMYAVQTQDGAETFTEWSTQPTLDTLREASRKYGGPLDRLDLWDAGLKCTACGEIISPDGDAHDESPGRFGAGPERRILCWRCATYLTRQYMAQVDPTKSVVSKSGLHSKSLCDHVLNVATGCGYACGFCYVKNNSNIRARQQMLKEYADVDDYEGEWGRYLLYRDDAPERLVHVASCRSRASWADDAWRQTDAGRGIVGMSFHTDCYQDKRAAQLARECIVALVKRERHVRVLSRSPAITRDIDVFKAGQPYVMVGSSIPTLRAEEKAAIEPKSPPVDARLRALQEVSDAGVPVFVSMSPTYPTQDKDDLRELMQRFESLDTLEVIYHEPINPRGENMETLVEAAREAGLDELQGEFERLRDDEQKWVDYAFKQLEMVRELGDELGLPVKLWPDKSLISKAGTRRARFLQREFDRSTPEEFAGGEPTLQNPAPTLADYRGEK